MHDVYAKESEVLSCWYREFIIKWEQDKMKANTTHNLNDHYPFLVIIIIK